MYVYRRNPKKQMRFFAFVSILVAGAFAGVYINATNTNGVHLGATAIPNLAFVGGVILFYVFGPEETRGASWVHKLADLREKGAIRLAERYPRMATVHSPATHERYVTRFSIATSRGRLHPPATAE